MAFRWSVKHDGISSDELLERLGVQVKLNNAGPLGQQGGGLCRKPGGESLLHLSIAGEGRTAQAQQSRKKESDN